jgi:tubulysin polyketide synthase-like protein
MTAHELLTELRTKGVEIKASSEDRLVIDAPKGTITEELRAALTGNKADLLTILKAERVQEAAKPAVPPEVPRPRFPEKSSAVETESLKTASAPVPASGPKPSVIAPSVSAASEEIARLEAELTRLQTEETARRSEVEAERLAAENALRVEQERWRKVEEELARNRAEQERQRIEAEAHERADEEKRRQIADQEIARAEAEVARMRKMEDARRREADEQIGAAQQEHELKLASLRHAEEEQSRRRTEEERHYLETEARKRAQEEELRRKAEAGFRAVEEEIERVQAREVARLKAEQEAQRLAEEAERRRAEEEARRKAEEQARRRAEAEARLRAEIEAQLRAEAAERRRAEEEARRLAEEEAQRRAEEEAHRLAAEHARRMAEAEAQRRAEEEARRQAEQAARLQAEEEERRRAEEQIRINAEQAQRERVEAEARERAELEARIRAEVEAKIRAEEAEQRDFQDAARLQAEHERILAEEAAKEAASPQYVFEIERGSAEELFESPAKPEDQFAAGYDDGAEFQPVSVPDENFASEEISPEASDALSSKKPAERAAALAELPGIGGEDAFRRICSAFDDDALEVRSAAARALFNLQEDRAAAFTRALREALPDRRRRIGAAIGASGLANEAIRNLTGESRDRTYDAFSLLFLMSKAGEVQPLMRAIEEHPSTEARLAVVKLLALSGQPEVLPAFRRMAVRGSLPADVRSAVMEAIYHITSQSPTDAASSA